MMRFRREERNTTSIYKFLSHLFGTSITTALTDMEGFPRTDWTEDWSDTSWSHVNGGARLEPRVGNSDYFSVGNVTSNGYIQSSGESSLNPGTGDYTGFVLVSTTETGEYENYLNKRDASNDGINIYNNSGQSSDQAAVYIEDINNNSIATGFASGFGDGEPHLLLFSIDKEGDELKVISDLNSTQTLSLSGSSVGEISPSNEIIVGIDNNFALPTDVGSVQVAGIMADEWMTKPQVDFLHYLLTDRSTQNSRRLLNSFFTGSHVTGLSRNLPNYLTNAFGASGPDFWWSADRHIHAVDGEGVVQMSNFAGTGFATQRTSSDQAVARSPSSRGEPLDHAEYSASSYYTTNQFSDDPAALTYVFVWQDQQSSASSGMISKRDPSDAEPSLSLFSRPLLDPPDVRVDFRDDSGSKVGVNIEVNGAAQTTIAVARFQGLDTTNQNLTIWVEDGTGIQSKSSSPSFSGDLSYPTMTIGALKEDGSSSAQKDVYTYAIDESAPSDSTVTTLISHLSSRYQ